MIRRTRYNSTCSKGECSPTAPTSYAELDFPSKWQNSLGFRATCSMKMTKMTFCEESSVSGPAWLQAPPLQDFLLHFSATMRLLITMQASTEGSLNSFATDDYSNQLHICEDQQLQLLLQRVASHAHPVV